MGKLPEAAIHARNLTIEHGALDAQVPCHPRRKFRKATEHVSISGDQLASTLRDVGERPEAIDFQLVDEFVGVEWLRTAGEPHGTEVSGQHGMDYSTVTPLSA